MKALTLNLLLVFIMTLIIAFLGIAYYAPIAEGISKFFYPGGANCGRVNQECCSPRNWCDTGLSCINGLCQENLSYEVRIDEDYLMYDASETASESQRDDYFSAKSGLGWEFCSNAASCENCSKLSNFSNSVNCLRCDLCNEKDNTCGNCLSCEFSDDNGDGSNEYEELYECIKCSGCSGFNQELADSCSVCSSCNMANKTLAYENGLACDECYQCDSNSNKCYSCYDCQMPNEKVCDACTKNPATFSTDCKTKHDYELCNKIKECVANFEGDPCEIEEMISIPWKNGYFLNTVISNILSHCINEDLKNLLPENVQQKICRYDDSKINFIQNYFISDDTAYSPPSDLLELFSISILGDVSGDCVVDMVDVNLCTPYMLQNWPPCDFNNDGIVNVLDMTTISGNFGKTCSKSISGENKGIFFNDCGVEKIMPLQAVSGTQLIYSSDPEIFTPIVRSTTPKTPEEDIPINVKIVIPGVSWNEGINNDCSYNIYLCAQEAIAKADNDTILDFYRTFAYFNESKYTFLTTPADSWKFLYGSTWVNVTGIKYDKKFTADLNVSEADVSHISKAIVAGLRDYFTLNSIYNETVNFFCYFSNMYPSYNDCYLNNVSVLINDNIPWKLNDTPPIDALSEIPYYKYIYYNSSYPIYNSTFPLVDMEVTFFTFVTNSSELAKNKIFVTPLITLQPHLRQCDDGIDNDGDGTCDWNGCGGMPKDVECTSRDIDSESRCGNGILEKGEECDRGPPMQDANCPGGCNSDCTCSAVYDFRCSVFKSINYGGDNRTADFESPSCDGIYKYPTSCTSESAYPLYSNDEGLWGEDVINRITIDGDHCSVRGRDVLTDNEQNRSVCVLCSNKPTTIIWGITWTSSRVTTIKYPIDWYTPDVTIPNPDNRIGEYAWYLSVESKTCPTFKYPVACLAKTPDVDTDDGQFLIDLYLDTDGKCKATWKTTDRLDFVLTYAFYVTLGIVCSDVQYSGPYYGEFVEKNDNNVEKFSYWCPEYYSPVSVFSKTDHSNIDSWMEDAIENVNLNMTGGSCYVYARDTGADPWFWTDDSEQKRKALVLCRYVG